MVTQRWISRTASSVYPWAQQTMVGLGHAVLECVKRERKRDQADRPANVVHPQAVENILTVLLRLTGCRRIFIGLGSRVAKQLQRAWLRSMTQNGASTAHK